MNIFTPARESFAKFISTGFDKRGLNFRDPLDGQDYPSHKVDGHNTCSPEILRKILSEVHAGEESETTALDLKVRELRRLPSNVIDCITDFHPSTTRDWLNMALSGEEGASEMVFRLLEQLGVERDTSVDPIVQLARHMFETVYPKASMMDKGEMVNLARKIEKEKSLNQKMAGPVGTIVKTIVGIIVLILGRFLLILFAHKVLIVLFRITKVSHIFHLAISNISRLANPYIKAAPLPIVKILNQALACGKIYNAHRFKIFLVSDILYWTVGGKNRYIRRFTGFLTSITPEFIIQRHFLPIMSSNVLRITKSIERWREGLFFSNDNSLLHSSVNDPYSREKKHLCETFEIAMKEIAESGSTIVPAK